MNSNEKLLVNPYELYYLVKMGRDNVYEDLISYFRDYSNHLKSVFGRRYAFLQDNDFESCLLSGIADSITDFKMDDGNDYVAFTKMCIARKLNSFLRVEKSHRRVKKSEYDEESGEIMANGVWLESLDDDVVGSDNLQKIDLVDSNVDVEDEVLYKLRVEDILNYLQENKGKNYRDVLQLRLDGYTYEEIAKKLNLTNKKVEYIKIKIRNILLNSKNDLI